MCRNRLTAAGAPRDLDAFKHAAGRLDANGAWVLDLERIEPSPPELRNADLVEWRGDHWGPSRNVEDVETLVDRVDELSVTFASAWAAPIPALEHVAKRHPRIALELVYYDASAPFAGVLKLEGGTVAREDFVDSDDDACLQLLELEGWHEGAAAYRENIEDVE